MWLQETSCSLPHERDPVLGREQGMSLTSSEVDYDILLYTWLHHVVELYGVYIT
jgi:hypothetical protein